MNVRGEYIFGYRFRIRMKAATKRHAVNHVGTKAEIIAVSLFAEPFGCETISKEQNDKENTTSAYLRLFSPGT